MSFASVYERAPGWLQSVAVAATGAFLEWQRYGGEFAELFAAASRSEFGTAAELAALREQLWSERVRRAVAEVEAYGGRDLSLDELRTLPVITKADVRRNPSSFVRRGRHGRLARVRGHTSGSTGAGLEFLMTNFVLRRNYAFTWRYRRAHGIPREEWCAVFGGRAIVPPGRREPPFWRVNPAGRTVLFSQYHLNPETAPLYIEEIRARGLRWIHGYPSVVSLLARCGADAGLAGATAVRWVTLSSENTLPEHREAISRMFGVRAREQYGMNENVALFSECPAGRLHVDEDYSLVEFLPIAELPGACTVVGTTLDNDLFPLVRYQVGDVVRLADAASCSCGRAGRIVASVDGRQDDYLVLSDGARVGRSAFFQHATRVAEAQLVQRAAGEATLRIVRAAGYADADEQALRDSIRQRLGDRLRIQFEYVDRLPRTAGGKLRLVVSEIPDARNAASTSRAAAGRSA